MRHRSQLGRAIWLLIALVGCGSDETPSNNGGTGGAAGAAGFAGMAGAAGSAGSAGVGGGGAAGDGGSAGSAGDGGAAGTGGSCDSCHGSDVNPAPPVDLDGNTNTTFPGVGAHQAHLGAGAWHKQVDCTECHTVPTQATWNPAEPGHMNGVNDLEWGSLAGSGTYDDTNNTCSNTYCHGASIGPDVAGGSSNRTPSWVVVDGSQAACGTSCHTLPPGGNHSPSTDCAACHGTVVASITAGTPPTVEWADPSLHINGTVDIEGISCTGCHGDPSTGDINPPVGTNGETETTDPAVGAHQVHLASSSWRRKGQCTDCHQLPGSSSHSNNVVDFSWGGPSAVDGANPSYASATNACSNVYCHGTTLLGPVAGGTVNRTPVWTEVDGTYNACGSTCHTTPPGGSHPNLTTCEACHGDVISSFTPGNPPTAVFADPTKHVDGNVDLVLGCTSCHGDPASGNPEPPLGTSGETSTTDPAVGAHASHLASAAWHRDGTCADCHATPGSPSHSNGAVDFSWGAPANADGATPSYSSTNNTCSNYCHGATLAADVAGQTSNRTPTWTIVDGSQVACGTSCHTLPPGGSHPNMTQCAGCHSTTISAIDIANPSAATWANKSQHINGTVNVP